MKDGPHSMVRLILNRCVGVPAGRALCAAGEKTATARPKQTDRHTHRASFVMFVLPRFKVEHRNRALWNVFSCLLQGSGPLDRAAQQSSIMN